MVFHQVTAEDGLWARPLLEQTHYRTCEFAFANIFMWAKQYGTLIGRTDDFVMARNVGRTHHHFLYPAGHGDLKTVIELCLDDSAEGGKNPLIYSIPKTEVPRVEELFPGLFRFGTDRNNDDYLYLASDLAQLPGKAYQKKRNHVSRFEKEHPFYKFEVITQENLHLAKEFNRIWGNMYDDGDRSLMGEHDAIDRTLDHFFELELKGGLLRDEEKPLAFCYGSKISDEVLCTHVEKAYHDVNGAYAVINREFAKAYGDAFTYINREDDLGEEGLRKAKLSYRPALLEQKFYAVLKTEG